MFVSVIEDGGEINVFKYSCSTTNHIETNLTTAKNVSLQIQVQGLL